MKALTGKMGIVSRELETPDVVSYLGN